MLDRAFIASGCKVRLLASAAILLLSASGNGVAQTLPLVPGDVPSQDVMALAPGGIDKAIEDLPGIVEEVMQRSGVPGIAVAVVHEGQTVFAKGFGVRELGKGDQVDADTVFQIASLSKPISGTIAAIQVAAGVVGWNDRAVEYLPDLRLRDQYVSDNATIGDFYAHRTGLPTAAGDDLEDVGYDRNAIIERLRFLALDSFRTSYHYANFGITIGAEAVAKASGKPWEELADEVLFSPLGMASSSFRYDDFVARQNRATLHAFQDGAFRPLFQRNADAQSPAGGASASVNDLARWVGLLLAGGKHGDKQIVSPEALLPALSAQAFSLPPHALDARAGFYGFGFNISTGANGRPSMGHSGAFILGGATSMQIIPSADLAVIVLTNGGPVGAAEAIMAHFMDVAQYGHVSRDWFALANSAMMAYYDPLGDLVGQEMPANLAPSHPLDDYEGAYKNEYFGPATIRKEGDGLMLVVGPARFTLELTHWDGDTFAAAPRSENAPSGSLSSVKFTTDGHAVSSFTVEYLDEAGMATWTR